MKVARIDSLPGLRLDSGFDRIVTLSSGLTVRLRWIRPADAPLIQEGYGRLSPESRYMRFFAAMRELPDPMLRYLTHVDGKNHAALLALSVPEVPGESERAVGVARFVRSMESPKSAELAVTVADDVQRRGLGTLLTTTLSAAAREREVETFTAQVLSGNVKAGRMLARLDPVRWTREGDVSSCAFGTSVPARRALGFWLAS